MKITGIHVFLSDDGTRGFAVNGSLEGREEIDPNDVARILDMMGELEGSGGGKLDADSMARASKIADEMDAAPSTEGNGRRRRGTASTEAAATEEAASEPQTNGRRRRSTAEAASNDAPAAQSPASDASTSTEPTGRRRRSGTTAEAEPEKKKEITDADLSKAASEAARTITPAKVTEILEGFDDKSDDRYCCGTVADLKPEDRQNFLDALTAAIKENT